MRYLFAFVFCLLMPFATVAQAQDDDVGFLAGLLQDALSGAGRDVQIRGFRGALSSEASIAVLSISDDAGEWFRAENISLVWTRSALLRGRVDVNSFTAERIVVSRAPQTEDELPSAEATPFRIPELPVSILIEEIDAPSVVLGEPLVGEEVEFAITGAASLDGGAADLQFGLTRTDGPEAQIQLAARFDPEERDLVIDFAAEEEANGLVSRLLNVPGRPALSLTVAGEGNIAEFDAQIALATNGEPRVTGEVVILAPEEEDSWDVRVDITGDPTPILTSDLQNFIGDDIGLKARIVRDASGRIDLPEFDLRARTLSLQGTAVIGASGWPETFEVSGRLFEPEGGPVVLPFGGGETQVAEVTFDAAYVTELILDARLTEFRNPAATLDALVISGRGEIDPAQIASDGQFGMDITLDAENLGLSDPALAAAVGTEITGAVRVDYTSDQPLRVTAIDLNGEDYGLTGSASLNMEETIPLGLDLRLVAQDVVRFSDLAGRPLSGRAEASIDGQVGPISGMFDVLLDATTLDLQIGQDVADRVLAGIGSARLDVRRDETGTTLRTARVVTAGANLNATGTITSEQTALRFGGEMRNLALLYPGEADGNADISGSVTLTGTRVNRAELTATLSNASQPVLLPFAGGVTLEDGTVEAIVTGGDTGSWTVQVLTEDISAELLSSDRIELSGAGPWQQAENGELVSIAGDLTASANGLRMSDARLASAVGASPTLVTEFDWTQATERLALDPVTLDTGVLDLTASALVLQTLSAPDAQFAASLVAQDFAPLSGLAGQPLRGRGSLEVTGSYAQGAAFDITVSGQAADVGVGTSVVNRLLTGVTEFDASVSGNDSTLERVTASVQSPEITARVSGPLSDLAISARLRDLGLIAPDFPGPLSVDGSVGQVGDTYRVDIDLDAAGGTALAVDGSVRGSTRADLTIRGDAPLGLANAFIEPRRLNGRAQLDLALRGPLALSSLSGTVTPVAAELSAPTLAIALAPITGQITIANSAAQIALSAQGNNGGTLDVNGRLGLTGFDAALTATLTRFGVRDPSLYDTSVDGTVTLSGPIGRDLLIAGDLRLNETEIQVPSSGGVVLGDIPNIEHLGATRPVMRTLERAGLNETPDPTASGPRRATSRLDLRLSAPNQVFVRGRGLDAELGGSLQLTGPTDNIIPQGGFELVRGRLDVLNQRFVLDEGRIQLSGSFVPVLRFVATTESNGIVVSVILDGPASAPDISFTSQPELPEDEVLAQLLFGRSLSNLSALQALELANAVAVLAGGGAGGILSNLRDGFGLDDLDVSQTAEGGAAVRAGAYLSENVYTDVVVESGGRTEINLNLDITSEITARGSVDNDGNSSVGVFFERDY